VTAEAKRSDSNRLRLASAAMVLAAVMCLGTFVIAARTPLRSKRDTVFVVGMGTSLALLTAGLRRLRIA
jgi:hypothetical protein